MNNIFKVVFFFFIVNINLDAQPHISHTTNTNFSINTNSLILNTADEDLLDHLKTLFNNQAEIAGIERFYDYYRKNIKPGIKKPFITRTEKTELKESIDEILKTLTSKAISNKELIDIYKKYGLELVSLVIEDKLGFQGSRKDGKTKFETDPNMINFRIKSVVSRPASIDDKTGYTIPRSFKTITYRLEK